MKNLDQRFPGTCKLYIETFIPESICLKCPEEDYIDQIYLNLTPRKGNKTGYVV